MDVTETILNTINTLLGNLFSSVDNNLYPVLDNMLFINSDILENTFISKIFGTSSSNGILLIANSLILGFALYYSIRLMFAYYTGSEVEKPGEFIFKLLLYSILLNCSYFLCEEILAINNDISGSILEIGKNLFKKDISFVSLIDIVNSNLYNEGITFTIFSLDGIIKSIISVGIFNLMVSYSLRYIMIKVFILICPFAILSLINKSTSWFFKTWMRSFLSLLFVQILVAIILLLPFGISKDLSKNPADIFNKLVLLGSIYGLIKANDYVREFMGGISTNVQTGISMMKGNGIN